MLLRYRLPWFARPPGPSRVVKRAVDDPSSAGGET
jgi:hypothetical protein